ncbi:MAG: GTP cyclohydrolase I [Anaerolineaceae bacterium]|nr:GTP cyclohydrolase I [Anaerolineaceae bacterium]
MSHLLQSDDEFEEMLDIHPREISDEQFLKFESYVSEIFSAFGMDVNTPSTQETPHRFIRALYDATNGYDGDPKVMKSFITECRGEPDCRLSQVVEGPINFFSLCEHHVFPFYGHAYVGYIAHENIIGISKLTRLVRMYARRFAVQERIGFEIADALEAILHPTGVAVYLEAHHLCMEMRGVREVAPMTRTTVWRGAFAEDATLRSEFFTACGLQRG